MYRIIKGNKYGAKRKVYNGLSYHSKKEAAYAQELELRKKAKDILDWRRQVKIPLVVNNIEVGNYYIDFVIDHNDGTEEFVEVKGFETNLWQLKWRIFEAMLRDNIRKGEVTLTVIK